MNASPTLYKAKLTVWMTPEQLEQVHSLAHQTERCYSDVARELLGLGLAAHLGGTHKVVTTHTVEYRKGV